MTQYGHWDYHSNIDINKHIGFVYCITNNLNGHKYYGQKQLWSKVTRPPLKGRKNKRRLKKESNWREYTGSSTSLNADIAVHGKDAFTFRILSLHDTKFALNYYEAKAILDSDAIIRTDHYNNFLGKIGSPGKQDLL